MKKLLVAAAALGAVASTPAMATAAPSADYTVTGTVAPTCNAGSGGTITFGTIALASDGTLGTNADQSSTGVNVYCNGVNATLSLAGHTIVNSPAPADTTDFTKTLSFTTTATVGGSSFTEANAQAFGAKAGSLVVTAASLSAGGKRPYAGSYTGTITVTLSPGA